jgi:hypothetical protein
MSLSYPLLIFELPESSQAEPVAFLQSSSNSVSIASLIYLSYFNLIISLDVHLPYQVIKNLSNLQIVKFSGLANALNDKIEFQKEDSD